MKKVHPWCGQPLVRGRLKNRTEHWLCGKVMWQTLPFNVVNVPGLPSTTDKQWVSKSTSVNLSTQCRELLLGTATCTYNTLWIKTTIPGSQTHFRSRDPCTEHCTILGFVDRDWKTGLKLPGRPKHVTIHHEWRLQSQDTGHIYNPEIPELSIAQAWDLWIWIVKLVWSNLDGPKKSPYMIIIHSNNCFCTIFTTAHMADTCTTYIRCIFFTHCHCSSSEKLLHSVRIQATTPTQSCSAKINPMFWQDPVIPARSWENQSGIAIPNYQVQRHSTL